MANEINTELQEAYFSTLKRFNDGDIVKGRIVEVRPREVIVDIGYKSEGIVLTDEFSADETPVAGGEIEVFIDTLEDDEGRLIISYQKAKRTVGWKKLSDDYKEGDIVDGIVTRRVKGGFMVEVFGTEGFLPASLSVFRNKPENEITRHKFLFQIIKFSRPKQNFVLSRKGAVRAERELARGKIWDSLKVGSTVKGRVKSITDFGAFIDLGGIDGLLHIADMSWKKVNHPSEIVAVGDGIEVMLLNIDKDARRLSLGMKQLTPDPWDSIDKRFPSGSIIKGKVTNIQNYGVFVELDKGIEGLVHVSEFAWGKSKINPGEMCAIGDMIEVKVMKVNVRERKISLSIKRLEKDPWESLPENFVPGEKVKGTVVGFIQNAAFIELSEGVESIVYTKDLSWTKRVNRPQEVLKRNHIYEFIILEIDRDNRRVVVGLKQLREDPWPKIIESYPVNAVIDTEVVKVTDFGVFVKLEDDLEGLIFEDEILPEEKEKIQPGQVIKSKIIKIDSENRKIGLSASVEPQDE